MGERLVRFADWRQRVSDKVTGYKIEVGDPKLKLPSVRPLVASYIEERRQQALQVLYPTGSTTMDPGLNFAAIRDSSNPLEDLTTFFVTGEILPFAQRAQAARDRKDTFKPTPQELRLVLSIEEGLSIVEWVDKTAKERNTSPTLLLPQSKNMRVTPQRVLYNTLSLLRATTQIPSNKRTYGNILRGY